MNTVDLLFSPSASRERRKFFLRVAKRANEMQRELVKKAQSRDHSKGEPQKRK